MEGRKERRGGGRASWQGGEEKAEGQPYYTPGHLLRLQDAQDQVTGWLVSWHRVYIFREIIMTCFRMSTSEILYLMLLVQGA